MDSGGGELADEPVLCTSGGVETTDADDCSLFLVSGMLDSTVIWLVSGTGGLVVKSSRVVMTALSVPEALVVLWSVGPTEVTESWLGETLDLVSAGKEILVGANEEDSTTAGDKVVGTGCALVLSSTEIELTSAGAVDFTTSSTFCSGADDVTRGDAVEVVVVVGASDGT